MAMPPKNVDHAIAILTGQVHALFMTCQAMGKAHPNPEDLLSRFEYAAQAGLASIENLPLKKDDVIDGYQFAAAGIRTVLEAAVAEKNRT
jgi:hypothetical protein